MKILLVDDHQLFTSGMQNLLEVGGYSVTGTAKNTADAWTTVQTLQPDLILMDINMPDGDGISLTARIKAEFPTIIIVMLTMNSDDDSLYRAMKYGASGYLLKNLDADQLFDCLEQIAAGEAVFSPEMANRMLQEYRPPQSPSGSGHATSPLTPRQEEVLTQVARGLSYKDVALVLEISETTVKFHMKEIIERLQLENKAQAIAYYIKQGPLAAL